MGNIKDLPAQIVKNCPEGGALDVSFSPIDSTTKIAAASNGWVDVPDESWKELFKHTLLAVDGTLYILGMLTSLVGMSGDFRIDVYDGASSTYHEEHNLNSQKPSLSHGLKKAINVPFVAGAYIAVQARMNVQNQSGRAFASLSIVKQ